MLPCLLRMVIAGACAALASSAIAQGVLGYWSEPGGSVIHIEACGADTCATLVSVSSQAPSRVDSHNPDLSLRSRSLCGLRIGTGFHQTGTDEASGGQLYDPKSGKTYRGTMRREGDRLLLRGYIGLPMFGRTETWQRAQPVPTCTR